MEKDFKLLTQVNYEYEAEQIKEILANNHIPSMSKIKGGGEIMKIYTGAPFNEKISIYVNEEDYTQAKELVYAYAKPMNLPPSLIPKN